MADSVVYSGGPAYGPSTPAASSTSSIDWKWVVIGIVVAGLIGVTVYFITGRADTRPIREGFGGAVTGTSSFTCSRMSSEAEELYSIFASRARTVGEEGSTDLRDLKNLLSKMCCLKQDLMSPAQTITAVKELGFATNMDIQPVADLTGRCFSKTIPERDLSVQFIKWRDFGYDLIRRLCTATQLTESEASRAEALFKKAWKDVNSVAQTQCLAGVPTGMFARGPHDPTASSDPIDKELREYDGYY